MAPTLRVFTDPRCFAHTVPSAYPEQPARLAGILDHLRAHGPGELVTAAGGGEAGAGGDRPDGSRAVAEQAVLALHDESYLRRFERAVARGDALLDSADNPLSPGTWEAAWAAVETALAAADWVAGGSGRRALAAVRPPGHHAERALAMGFCFFNNAAVAAEHLRRRGLARGAIFDFDVHHGNGTQHLFEERADIFYASTHQYPFYPGTGAAGETGAGAGAGATLNVPLPAGTGDAGYEQAITAQVLPVLRRFAPDLLVLSAGFDSWQHDPLGGLEVSEEGFRRWGEWLGGPAPQPSPGTRVA